MKNKSAMYTFKYFNLIKFWFEKYVQFFRGSEIVL